MSTTAHSVRKAVAVARRRHTSTRKCLSVCSGQNAAKKSLPDSRRPWRVRTRVQPLAISKKARDDRRMASRLFERFNVDKRSGEAHFREEFVKPFLWRLGFQGVETKHGPAELGKDFVFSEHHKLAGIRYYAAQCKHVKAVRQAQDVSDILRQIQEAFDNPFIPLNTPRDCYVSAVYIFNSGEFTEPALRSLSASLRKKDFGDNVHFFGGERLQGINDHAVYHTERSVNARLRGLLAQLNVNLQILHTLCVAKIDGSGAHVDSRRFMFDAVEGFISEPMGGLTDEFMQTLETYWYNGSAIDSIRQKLLLAEMTPKEQRIRDFERMVRLAKNMRDQDTQRLIAELVNIMQQAYSIPLFCTDRPDRGASTAEPSYRYY